MKKRLHKNILLSLSCLLGLGGLAGIVLSNDKEAVKANAAAQYYEIPEASVTAEQLISGSGPWSAYTNATITSEKIGGVTYAKIKQTTAGANNKRAAIKYSGDGHYFRKWVLTYTLTSDSTCRFQLGQSTSTPAAYVKTLEKGTLKTVYHEYSYDEYLYEGGSDVYSFYPSVDTDALYIYSFTFYEYAEAYSATITAGSGIESVFLSTATNATSGSASGTSFKNGSTVYGYVTLKAGYNPNTSDWTQISGNIYRIKVGKTINNSAVDFGTISAPSATKYTISYNLGGGTSVSNPTEYYVNSENFTLNNPTKTGYTFAGWTGTGLSEPTVTVTVTKGSMGNRSYTANWTPNQYNITYYDGISGSSYSGDNSGSLISKHTYGTDTNLVDGHKLGYTFNGWFDNVECEGEPITVLNGTSYLSGITLYAKWTINAAIQNAIDKINEIGEVTYPGSKDKIEAARAAYEAVLPVSDREAVTNYATLLAAEATYANLENQAKANAVKDLITAIGDVSYLGSKDAIDAARAAYDDLTSDQKALVTNYSTLTSAESTYASLRSAAIDNVESLITAIGEVSYPGSKDEIDAARAAYNALLDSDQPEVSNRDDLFAAEARYQELEAAHVAAESVKALISAIGEVKYPDSKAVIEAAREAYDALSSDAKSMVDNLATLTAAESTYASLRSAAIDNVESLITAIGEVSYPGSKDAIKAARDAYNALLEGDQPEVSNRDDLFAAEARYAQLAKEGADAVKALIDGIGNFEYTQDCKDKIDAARAAYDALTEEQKALVTNYITLTHDEDIYSHITVVVELIESIGNVEYSKESQEKIEAAREAYDALSEEEKNAIPADKVDNLVQAEQAYEELVEAHKGLPGWAIALIVIGSVILACLLCYVVLFFLLNKWIKKDGKAIRVLPFNLGKKDGKSRVMVFPCKIEYRENNEIFNSKEDALK